MPDTETIKSIITSSEVIAGVIGAFTGAVLGGWLTYLGAIRIQRFAMRENAKDDFRHAIMPSYMRIKNRMSNCPFFLLIDESHGQLLAYHHFRDSVAWHRRRSLDTAWKDYFGTFDDFPHQYHEHPEDEAYCKKMFEIVEHRLKRLLDFT